MTSCANFTAQRALTWQASTIICACWLTVGTLVLTQRVCFEETTEALNQFSLNSAHADLTCRRIS